MSKKDFFSAWNAGTEAANGDEDILWETTCSFVLGKIPLIGPLSDKLCEDTNPLNLTKPSPQLDPEDMESLDRMAKAHENRMKNADKVDPNEDTEKALDDQEEDAQQNQDATETLADQVAKERPRPSSGPNPPNRGGPTVREQVESLPSINMRDTSSDSGDSYCPIVLDLDGDGKVELINQEGSTAFYDFNDDGYREQTGWASGNISHSSVPSSLHTASEGRLWVA